MPNSVKKTGWMMVAAAIGVLAWADDSAVGQKLVQLRQATGRGVEPAKLIAAAEKLLADNPASADLVNAELVRLYLLTGQSAKAEEIFKKLPKDGEAKSRALLAMARSKENDAASPLYAEFFSRNTKPLSEAAEDKEEFSQAIVRQAGLLRTAGKKADADKILELIKNVEGGEAGLRQAKVLAIRSRHDAEEQNLANGLKVDKAELGKVFGEVEELRKAQDEFLAAAYVEGLRAAWMLADDGRFDGGFFQKAVYYCTDIEARIRDAARGQQAGKKDANDTIEAAVSEYSPLAGVYYYYGLAMKARGDEALAKGKTESAKELHTLALRAFLVVNRDYFHSTYNDKAKGPFDDLVTIAKDKYSKVIRNDFKVKDRVAVLAKEIAPLLAAKNYDKAETVLLAALRTARGRSSMVDIAGMLMACWIPENGSRDREWQAVATAIYVNELMPDDPKAKELLLSLGGWMIAQGTANAQRPELLDLGSFALERFIDIHPADPQAAKAASSVAELRFTGAMKKAQEARTKKNPELDKEARADFLAAGAAFEKIIARWPDSPEGIRVRNRAGWSFKNGGDPSRGATWFLDYADKETDPAKWKDRLDSLLVAGSAMLSSEKPEDGERCLSIYRKLHDLVANGFPGFPAETPEGKKYLADATAYLGYGYAAMADAARNAREASEAENTIIEGRLRDIADEIQRRQANVKALQKGIETLRAEVAEYVVEFTGSYEKDLQEAMAEKAKGLGGDPAKMAEAERRKFDELMAAETKRFRDAYVTNRLQSLRTGIESWTAQEAQFAQEASRQKQVLTAKEDECRRIGGELAEAAKRYASLKLSVDQRQQRFGEADTQMAKKKLEMEEGERLYQEALAKHPEEIIARRTTREKTKREFEEAERFLHRQVSDKDRARLKTDQAEMQALYKKAQAGDKLMTPFRELLALEKAKFDLLSARQQAAAAAAAFCRLASANRNFDAPEVRAAAAVPATAWNKVVELNSELAVILERQEVAAQEVLRAEQLAKQKKLAANRKGLGPSVEREKTSKTAALKWLRDYLAFNVKDVQMMPMVLAKTAFILVDQGDFAGAEAMLKRLSTEFPQSSVAKQAQFTLGRAQCEGGQFAAAAASFEKALRETGREMDLSSLNYIVNRMSDNGQPTVAMQAATLLRERTPKEKKDAIANWSYLRQNALLRYGKAAIEAKEYDSAVTVLDELLAGFKDGWARIEALQLLAVANRSKTPPDLAAAADALERALANRGLEPEERLRMQCQLAETCALRADRAGLEEAAGAYELVLIAWTPAAAGEDPKIREKLDVWHEKAWLEFARLKARLGDRKRAEAAAADYRANFPKGRYLNEIGNLPEPDAAVAPAPAAGKKEGAGK